MIHHRGYIMRRGMAAAPPALDHYTQVVQSLQTIVSRETDPLSASVVSVTKVGGDATGVSPHCLVVSRDFDIPPASLKTTRIGCFPQMVSTIPGVSAHRNDGRNPGVRHQVER